MISGTLKPLNFYIWAPCFVYTSSWGLRFQRGTPARYWILCVEPAGYSLRGTYVWSLRYRKGRKGLQRAPAGHLCGGGEEDLRRQVSWYQIYRNGPHATLDSQVPFVLGFLPPEGGVRKIVITRRSWQLQRSYFASTAEFDVDTHTPHIN